MIQQCPKINGKNGAIMNPSISKHTPGNRNHLFSQRKGLVENILWTLIWFAIFIMVMVFLQLYLARVSNNDRFDMVKSSHDLALTGTASPIPFFNYDILLPQQTHRFSAAKGWSTIKALGGKTYTAAQEDAVQDGAFQDGAVQDGVAQLGVAQEQEPYSLSLLTPLSTQEFKPGIYHLSKDGNNLLIAPKQGLGIPPLTKLSCPLFIPSQRIILDPGHGGLALPGDPGDVFETLTESALTTAITQEISTQLTSHGFTVARTRTDNSPLSFQTRMDRITSGSALISIHTHPSIPAKMPTITAIINNHAARKTSSIALACTLLNALLDNALLDKALLDDQNTGAFSGGNIIAMDTTTLPDLDDRHVLDKPETGVYLILSGIDLPRATNPLSQPSLIGKRLASLFSPPELGAKP